MRNEILKLIYLKALKMCDGNKTHAAKILGVSIKTVRKHCQIFGFKSGVHYPKFCAAYNYKVTLHKEDKNRYLDAKLNEMLNHLN